MERETKTSRGDVALRQGKQKEAPWTSSCLFRRTAGEELGRLDTDGLQARGDEAEEAGFAAGDGAVKGGANGRSSGSWLEPRWTWAAMMEALLGDERAGEGKTRRRGGWLAVVGGSGGDGSKEEDRWWLVGSMDPEGDLVESGGGQEDGWDISLEVRVCPYLD